MPPRQGVRWPGQAMRWPGPSRWRGRGGGAHGADHAAGAGGEDTKITQNRGTIAFAVCGSFCTLEAALQSARALTAQGWQLLPVMSFAARQDTRFGTGNYWKEQLEAAAGHPVLDTLQAVEPLGPHKMAQALVVAPCTGATLSRLAAEHEMSVSHLQKLFKQIYGVPVYHYIKEYRLEQAAVELVRSARPVTEIAQDAGYDNASKFSACFKERYGVTPSQYRTDAKAKQSIGTKTE